jgi:hypothetical protein
MVTFAGLFFRLFKIAGVTLLISIGILYAAILLLLTPRRMSPRASGQARRRNIGTCWKPAAAQPPWRL